ncbi:MAG: LVIVD repeat-containing protein [Candidatus Heimdallarchaeota archaeon]
MNTRTKFSVLVLIVVMFSSTLIQSAYAIDTTDIEEMKTYESNSTEELTAFNLKKISRFDFGKKVIDVHLGNDIAYLADEDKGLLLVNISDYENPVLINDYQVNGESVNDFLLYGNIGFVAHGSEGLRVIDLTDKTNIVEINSYTNTIFAWKLFLAGSYLYVVDPTHGIMIFDISVITNPVKVGQYNGHPYDVFVRGDYAFIAAGLRKGLEIVDISDKAAPNKVAEITGDNDDSVSVYVSGDYAFLGSKDAGTKIVNIEKPKKPELITQYTGTSGSTWDVVVSEHLLYTANEFGGIEVLDITEKIAPKTVGRFYEEDNSRVFSITLRGNYLFTADYTNGLEILSWKIAKPNPVIGAYETIAEDTVHYNHSVSPIDVEFAIGNETLGLNASLEMSLGFSAPVTLKAQAPIERYAGDDINLILSLTAGYSYFWVKFIGEIKLISSLISRTFTLSNESAMNPLQIITFPTFIGENLSESRNLEPLILFDENITQYNISIIMTPVYNVTGSAVAYGDINTGDETHTFEWQFDNEPIFYPLTLPENEEETHNVTVENLHFEIDALNVTFDHIRIDVLLLDSVPIYTIILNDTILGSSTTTAKTGYYLDSEISKQASINSLFYLDGVFPMGDFLVIINYSLQKSLPAWATILAIVGSIGVLVSPWALVALRNRPPKIRTPE